MRKEKTKKVIKKTILILFLLGLLGIIYSLVINSYVKNITKEQIITVEEKLNDKSFACILILGAGIWGDKPSPMLEDRLIKGLEAYNNLKVPIIVSGDHGQMRYDEVNVMKDYLIDAGVPSSDIYMDHAGFSTYESIYRAKEIFKTNNILIITQKYHLYRALYIAQKLDVKAYGYQADIRIFKSQPAYDFREYLARNKDFIKTIFKPNPTYLGDAIPLMGDGDVTND